MIDLVSLFSTLSYDPDSGLLSKNGLSIGFKKKCKKSGKHYIQITIKNKTFLAHRVIWFIKTGSWPIQIDHIDGDGTNNRWSNLREVDNIQNQKNKRKYANNKSGTAGVRWHTRDKIWISEITVNKKKIHLGCFKKLEEAISKRQEAKRKYDFSKTHGTDRELY